MKVGEFVAAVSTKYEDRPLIGKVLENTKNSAKIAWYMGTYNSVWKPWKGRSEGDREVVHYSDEVDLCKIIKSITFTEAMRIPPATALALKKAYSEADAKLAEE